MRKVRGRMYNKLKTWLNTEDPTSDELAVRVKQALMPDNLSQKEKDLLFFLLVQILMSSVEGSRLISQKDPYNSYLYMATPQELQQVDLIEISDKVKGLNIVNDTHVSTPIDYIYEALIYILENYL